MSQMVKTGEACSSVIADSRLDFIGQVLCPMKANFKQGYDEVAEQYKKETGCAFYSYVPTICGSKGDRTEATAGDILKYLTIDDLPGMIASFGLGDYFSSQFRERFLKQGYFESIKRNGLSPAFEEAGIDDPSGEFYIYSGYPAVFLVDRKKLGDLPVPRKWEDLLSPVYRNNITIGGAHGMVSKTLLLYLYKMFGDEGLKMLEPNVRQAMHPSEMAKLAGTSAKAGTAIYVMMLFFGKACGKTDRTELVWPEDGAIFDPAFILVKKGMTEKYQVLIDYITGERYGKISAANSFPVTTPLVKNPLPEGAKLQWLGWDFINSHRMEEVVDHVTEPFQKFLI
ncbi:Bacterial extracellular solute-binding protein [Caprobacter fermentans]|uniref:Bacterial extracellular solute-binding protein n=1 Tax=Caproicibacter fermentans TaxID=2576756 RepID=A0A6N8HYY2_9FIRM|nr:ABC transporter substrate-binding protein [Caproicibacter fermentans]MVB10687.1 Bacterial extracellular solute-binding protein [Caproicibacter fermentans]